MIEAIAGGGVTVALSIIANLLTPHVQNMFGHTIPNKYNTVSEPNQYQFDDTYEGIRATNRLKLKILIATVMLYIVTYVLIYSAFYLPLALHTSFLEIKADLRVARYPFEYIINKDNIATICTVSAILVYLPLLMLSKIIATFIGTIVDNFVHINLFRGMFITIVVMSFCAAFTAANVRYYINPDLLWWDSIKFCFLFLLATIGLFFSRT